jgi:pantetheine-phosphate adenylyltransferase
MKIAVYAGSFDPLTNGHLWMIREGAKLFDQVIVGISTNPNKTSTFTEYEREMIVKTACIDLDNVIVESAGYSLLANFAKDKGADFLLRGIRNLHDYEYENIVRNVNNSIGNISTVFLMPPKELTEVSSSFVKDLRSFANWDEIAKKYVPKITLNYLIEDEMDRFAKEEGFNASDILYDVRERPYHNINHIYEVVSEISGFNHKCGGLEEGKHDSPDLVKCIYLASYLHDVVCVPGAKDNEEKSASYASGYCWEKEQELVEELILDTKHVKKPRTFGGKLLCDADLAGLGKSYEEFSENGSLIWAEYSPTCGKLDFLAGRKKFFEGMLKKKRIFHTEYFFEKYEKSARDNMKRWVFEN